MLVSVQLGNLRVESGAAERAGPALPIALARILAGAPAGPSEWALIHSLSPKLLLQLQLGQGACGVPLLRLVDALIELNQSPGRLREQVQEILRPAARDSTRSYRSEHVVVSYEDSGPEAVDPDTSAETVTVPATPTAGSIGELPAGGAPTYVRRLAVYLEYLVPLFRRRFGLPPFPVEVLPIQVRVANTVPFAECPNHIHVGPRLSPGLLFSYAGHELFHLFQWHFTHQCSAASLVPRRATVGGVRWDDALEEGGAVFAEDAAADGLNRYMLEAGSEFNGVGLLAQPNQPLSHSSYKASLFWHYLAEQAATQPGEPPNWALYTRIWDAMAPSATTTALELALDREFPQRPAFRAWRTGPTPGDDVLVTETLFGNFALACYLKDTRAGDDRRFTFRENADRVGFFAELTYGQQRARDGLRPVATVGPVVLSSAGVTLNEYIQPFAHRFVELGLAPDIAAVTVSLELSVELSEAFLCQVVLLDEDGGAIDIIRADRPSFRRVLAARRGTRRATKVVVVLSALALPNEIPAPYSVSVTPVPDSRDATITRWNCEATKGYESPRPPGGWDWRSPDIYAIQGAAEDPVYQIHAGCENTLAVRVHNLGGVDLRNASAELAYQPGTPATLVGNGWRPLLDPRGRVQCITGLDIPAGGDALATITWLPPRDLANEIVCVRAHVAAQGDVNTDNKRALSAFGCVTP